MCMKRTREVLGYETQDGKLYCMNCFRKNHERMKDEIVGVVIGEEFVENRYICDACGQEIDGPLPFKSPDETDQVTP